MPIKQQMLRPTRITLGDGVAGGKKSLLSVSLDSFDLMTPAAASTTAISAAVTGNASTAVTTPLNVVLPAPRSITVTSGGTGASIAAVAVVVTGKNVEGKTITESLTPVAATPGTLSGTKVFHTVTGFTVPVQTGAGATFSVGTGNNFGIGFRNLSVTQVRLLKTVVATGVESLVAPASTNFSTTVVEDNWVTLDATAAGTSKYRVYAFNYNWQLNPTNDNPNYGF